MRTDVISRNNVRSLGDGSRTMMFAHGFGCDQTMWRFVTPAFEHDYRIVLFDYVGCGKSDPSAFDPTRYRTLAGYARDVVEICDALELKDVVFVGHSVSSVIGMLAAIERPELFADLVLVCPSPCYINDGEYQGGFEHDEVVGLLDMMEKNFIGWANFLAPVVMKNPDRPELAEELEESFCAVDPDAARTFATATFLSDNRKDLNAVRTPALVMQCTDDAIAPIEVGEYVHRNLATSSFALMQATGHCPHMSHPRETIEVIKGYLEREA